MSEYNVGGSLAIDSAAIAGKRVLLVPGQVEDDASIRLGAPAMRTNEALLRTVRENNPNLYIIYKQHPDVVAGNRREAVPGSVLKSLYDDVVVRENIIDCIVVAEELHTMTSLSGFEDLLNDKAVHCYGQPFYAGWGLTTDHAPHARRIAGYADLWNANPIFRAISIRFRCKWCLWSGWSTCLNRNAPVHWALAFREAVICPDNGEK